LFFLLDCANTSNIFINLIKRFTVKNCCLQIENIDISFDIKLIVKRNYSRWNCSIYMVISLHYLQNFTIFLQYTHRAQILKNGIYWLCIVAYIFVEQTKQFFFATFEKKLKAVNLMTNECKGCTSFYNCCYLIIASW
jgi:hypothetical protein